MNDNYSIILLLKIDLKVVKMQLGFTGLKEKHRASRDNWTSTNAQTTGLKVHCALVG
ncbi:MAG: hypothetical protein OCD02_11385 [Spirochaetaceae bacterium]